MAGDATRQSRFGLPCRYGSEWTERAMLVLQPSCTGEWKAIEIKSNAPVILSFLAVLIVVVVGVDVFFLRNRFWERLIVNLGIVAAFVGFYFGFLKNH
jgi:hypothetical protein